LISSFEETRAEREESTRRLLLKKRLLSFVANISCKMQNYHHQHPNSNRTCNSFAQWLKACEHRHSCLRQWSDRLIELGASWESFRNCNDSDGDDDMLVQDLVNGGGIPLLAARDIVRIVTRAMRGNLPMAIFWE
jgi:hypothetical protein